METKSWTTVDKSDWGDGPWQGEPDKVQWTDEATGLPCLIKRGPGGPAGAERVNQLTDILAEWEAIGFIEPVWSVEWDSRFGCYRSRFTVRGIHDGQPHSYSLTEAEMCIYILGAVDWAPGTAGKAAALLADAERPS